LFLRFKELAFKYENASVVERRTAEHELKGFLNALDILTGSENNKAFELYKEGKFNEKLWKGKLKMTEQEFMYSGWKMSYEEYKECYCPDCDNETCAHRETYRRFPKIDGGLALCPNLTKEN